MYETKKSYQQKINSKVLCIVVCLIITAFNSLLFLAIRKKMICNYYFLLIKVILVDFVGSEELIISRNTFSKLERFVNILFK
jgi:hypothetical protein